MMTRFASFLLALLMLSCGAATAQVSLVPSHMLAPGGSATLDISKGGCLLFQADPMGGRYRFVVTGSDDVRPALGRPIDCPLDYGAVPALNSGRTKAGSWISHRFGYNGRAVIVMPAMPGVRVTVIVERHRENGPLFDPDTGAGAAAFTRLLPNASTAAGPIGGMNAGERFQDCPDVCPLMVTLPAGRYLRGTPVDEPGREVDEAPQGEVRIGRPFAIGVYEVSNAELAACVAAHGCSAIIHDPTDGRKTAASVSWQQAREYTNWLSAKTGQRYMLPSEAEWEYAARAGTTTPWTTGNALLIGEANIMTRGTGRIGSHKPNAFGLHDVHGNAAEWTLDCSGPYRKAPADGAMSASGDCSRRISRGGSDQSHVYDTRSGARSADSLITITFPDGSFTSPVVNGFRVVRVID